MVKERLSQEQEREAEVGKNNHRDPQEVPLRPLEDMVLCGCLFIQRKQMDGPLHLPSLLCELWPYRRKPEVSQMIQLPLSLSPSLPLSLYCLLPSFLPSQIGQTFIYYLATPECRMK